jgi:hypothetical protein
MKHYSKKIHKKIKKSKKYLGGMRRANSVNSLFATAKTAARRKYGEPASGGGGAASGGGGSASGGNDSPIPFIDLTPELRKILDADLLRRYSNPSDYSVVIEKYSWLDKSDHDCLMSIINAFFNVEICALANGNPGQKKAAQSFNRDHYQKYIASVMVDRTLSTRNWQSIADWFTSISDTPVLRPDSSEKSKAKAASTDPSVFIADLKGRTILFNVTTIKLGKDMIGAHVVPIKFIALFIKFLKKLYSENMGTNDYDECFNNLDEKCTVIPATAAVNDDDNFLTREGCLSGYLILYNLLYTLGDSCYRIISDAIDKFGNDALRCMGMFDGIFGVIIDSSSQSTGSDPFIEKVSFIPSEKDTITNALEQLQSKVLRDEPDASLLSCILESFGDPFACNTEQSVLEIVINLDKNLYKDSSYDLIKRKVIIKNIAEPRSRIGYKTLFDRRRAGSIMSSDLEMFYRANFNMLFKELLETPKVKLLRSVQEIKKGILANFNEGIEYLSSSASNVSITPDILSEFVRKLKCATYENAMDAFPPHIRLAAHARTFMKDRLTSGAAEANNGSQNVFVEPVLSEEDKIQVKIATAIIIELSGGTNGSFSSHEQSKYYAKLIENGTVTIDGNTATYCGVIFTQPVFTRPLSILASDFITSLLGQIDSKIRKLKNSIPKDTPEPQYVCIAVNEKYKEYSIAYRICLIDLYNEFLLRDNI